MSSLLQSPGRVRSRKGQGEVEIFIYLVTQSPRDKEGETIFAEENQLEAVKYPPGHRNYGTYSIQPVLYRIWRKPRGMFGCWVVFNINGEEMAPDLSVPTRLLKLPRDAERLTHDEAAHYWFNP